MSSEEYLRWQALLYKVAKRYVGINNLYDLEDLIQIGSIGLAKGLESYNPTLDIPLKNWLYRNVAWTICRELDKNKSIDAPMSLYTPLGEDEDTTLEEIIADDNVDVEEEVCDRLIKDIYISEIEKYITDKKKLNICLMRWFEGCSYNYIERVLECKNISGIIRESRMHLVSRSRLFKEEYRRIKHISEYETERVALI